MDNAFEYAEGLKYELTVDGKKTKKAMAKRDQFGPELLYFSDCILQRRQPEPSSNEGMQDVCVIAALYESARTGRAVRLPHFSDRKPRLAQQMRKPGIKKPALIHAVSSSVD